MKNLTHKYVIERFAHLGIEFLGKVKLEDKIGLMFNFPKRKGIVDVERRRLKFLDTVTSTYSNQVNFYNTDNHWRGDSIALSVNCYLDGRLDALTRFVRPQIGLIDICVSFYHSRQLVYAKATYNIHPIVLHIEQTCFAFCQGKVPGPILLDFLRDQPEIREAGCHF